MGKINILTPGVYNRIAAGEVVDRPYSVVKELVENAIDANATEIVIRIEKGGKSYISVTDNGGGIEYSDLKNVFLPHATSKISKANDLENITTLGFRGEAVASISSVSHMRYTSKCDGLECYKIECNGGIIGEPVRTSGVDGTTVEVEDLFYNTPVRLKFLKSDKAEEGDITTFVYRFILSHPEISFKYYADNRLLAQSFGEGEEETLVSVYGANILSDTYRIETEKHGVKIRGYISNQNFFKPNRSYQSVFLNGRYIVNNTISAAITNAYASYAMKRQYPFYVLHIDLPPEVVDVNVHPNKADVRFADNQVIYGCIYSVIAAVLDGNSKALEYVTPSVENSVPEFTYEQAKNEIRATMEEKKTYTVRELPFEEVRSETQTENNIKIADVTAIEPPKKNTFKPYSDLFFEENKIGVSAHNKTEDFYEENKRFLAERDASKADKGQLKIDVNRCEYKGNLFNTFLIYELGDDAYLIDQHAAHERLIFDRLKKKTEERTVAKQPMLIPYKIHVSPAEAIFLEDCMPALCEIGFDITEEGISDFTVTAVPVDLQDITLDKFFADVLHDVSGLRGIKLAEILRDRLAMMACKAAIKGGMSLTEEEVKQLLKDMNGDTGLKCPHGRPAVVKLSKYEIEKMFKRIV